MAETLEWEWQHPIPRDNPPWGRHTEPLFKIWSCGEMVYATGGTGMDGVILHYNRGCEGLSVGIAENRLGLLEKGHKVMTYEGNMGDEREFDKEQVEKRFDIFLDSMGLTKPEEEK